MTHIPPHDDGSSQPENFRQPSDHRQPRSGSTNEYFDFTGYRFRIPPIWPKSVGDVRVSRGTGFKGIFETAHMPMDARIGYWAWLVGSVLNAVSLAWSLVFIFFAIIFNPFLLIASGMMSLFGGMRWDVIVGYIISVLILILIVVVQFLLTLKIREGSEWARFALTALSLVSFVYYIVMTAAGSESSGGGRIVVAILSLLVLVPFWMPKANTWFTRTTDLQHRRQAP